MFRERMNDMKRLSFALILVVLAAACAPLAAPATNTPPPPAPTETPADADLTPAQRAARQALMASLNLSADQVRLISAEAVDWPDGCLGVRRLDALCAQGIVPGYRLVMEAEGQRYEYHTNQDGSVIAPDAPTPASDAAVQAAREALQAALGLEASEITLVERTLMEWSDACLGLGQPNMICAQALTPGWLIVLEAQGRAYTYHANADGSAVYSATLALRWHREGGLAGFCDDLLIEWSGVAQPRACKLRLAYPEGALTDAELQQLQAWGMLFGTVTLTQTDEAAADAMTLTLSLSGFGLAQPTEAEQQAMLEWAQAVFTRLARP